MSHIIRKSPELVSIARQNLYKSLSLMGITNTTNTTNTTNLYYSRLTLPVQQVIRFAGLAPEPFGHQAERLLIRELGLQPRTAHDHDGILELTGHRIEIKCARYQISSGKYKSSRDILPDDLLHYKSSRDILPDDLLHYKYKWTRINPLAGFDLLLLALLDWDGFVIRILDRQQVLDLAERIAYNPHGKFVIRGNDLLSIK